MIANFKKKNYIFVMSKDGDQFVGQIAVFFLLWTAYSPAPVRDINVQQEEPSDQPAPGEWISCQPTLNV